MIKDKKKYIGNLSIVLLAFILILFFTPMKVKAKENPQGNDRKYNVFDSPYTTVIDPVTGEVVSGMELEEYDNIISLKYTGLDADKSIKLISGTPVPGKAPNYYPGAKWRISDIGTYRGQNIEAILTVDGPEIGHAKADYRGGFNPEDFPFRYTSFQVYGDVRADTTMKIVYEGTEKAVVPEPGERLYVIFTYTADYDGSILEVEPLIKSQLNTNKRNGGIAVPGIHRWVFQREDQIQNMTVTKKWNNEFEGAIPPKSRVRSNVIYELVDENTVLQMKKFFEFPVGTVPPKGLNSHIKLFERQVPLLVQVKNPTPVVINTVNDNEEQTPKKAKIEVEQRFEQQSFEHYYADEFTVTINTHELIKTSGTAINNFKVVDSSDENLDYTSQLDIDSSKDGEIKVKFLKKDLKQIKSSKLKFVGEFDFDEYHPDVAGLIKNGFVEFPVTAENTDNPKFKSEGVTKVITSLPYGEGIDQVVDIKTSTEDLEADKVVKNLKSAYSPNGDDIRVLGFSEKVVFDQSKEYTVYVEIIDDISGKKGKVPVKVKVNEFKSINVTFIKEGVTDQQGEPVVLHKPVVVKAPIGESFNLAESPEVSAAIAKIEGANHTPNPNNPKIIQMGNVDRNEVYKFSGMLFIKSSPKTMGFGRNQLHNVAIVKNNKATYEKPFIIWDNTEDKTGWTLKAKLDKPLESVANPSVKLPDSLRYKTGPLDSDFEVLSALKNVEVAKKPKTLTADEYKLSDGWDNNETGVYLEVPSYEVKEVGDYKTSVVWEVGIYP